MTAPAQEAPREERETIGDVILSERGRKIIEGNLPDGVTIERVAQQVQQVWYDKPELHECTAISIVRAVGKAVAWNLPIGDKVHLVPFNQKVKLANGAVKWETRAKALLDYRGKLDLLYRHGAIRSHVARCVFSKEKFRMVDGAKPWVEHERERSEALRGDLQGAYVLFIFDTLGYGMLEYLTVEEIERDHRAKSKSWQTREGEHGERVKIPLEEILWFPVKSAIHSVWNQAQARMERNSKFSRLPVDDEETPEQVEAETADAAALGFRALSPAEEKRVLGAGPVETVVHGRKPSAVLSQLNVPQDDPCGFTRQPRTEPKL
jgi:recombinational DNA repair protein RecT